MADPLDVTCPDCQAPPTVACRTSYDYPHATRTRTADLHALTHGTCTLCGQPMVYGPVEDTPPDAWHPDPTDAAACPPLPDPRTDWTGYARATQAGYTPGHPGIEHFTPLGSYRCPHGTILTDTPGPCGCYEEVRDGAPLTLDAVRPEPDGPTMREVMEEGRRLASEREDLIAAGVDPSELAVPLAPGMCPACEHPSHQGDDCSAITGYDHLNGDHDCGCTGHHVCPDCLAGKHINCTGEAWDHTTDEPAPCTCTHRENPTP